jgi:hypothetical protein
MKEVQIMKCKKRGSENLKIVDAGPHKKLVCADYLAFQKFLSKADAKTFEQLKKERT